MVSPDTLKDLVAHKVVHLDSKKIFNPALINNICDIFSHYINNDLGEQIILNIGVDKKTTYHDFIRDVSKALGLDTSLIKNDGDEEGWPMNSSISVNKVTELGYPTVNYEDMLNIIAKDFEISSIAEK